MLDPHPDNLLGKDIFPPEVEAELLAEGAVFATYKYIKSQKTPIIVSTPRPYVQTITKFFRDMYYPRPSSLPNTSGETQ